MKDYIKNNPVELLDKEDYTVLINSREKTIFHIFMGFFFYIGSSELTMDKLLNLKEWEILVRLSYLILFAYLWVRYGQKNNKLNSVIATGDGLFFLISETSKEYPGLYFFVNWNEIEHISVDRNNDERLLEIKTKIPLVKTTSPLISTRIPLLKDIHLRKLPERYEKISLQRASFRQPEVLNKTVIIEPCVITGLKKWTGLAKKYPVKVLTL